ncbi:uncharacterized protein JCM10292_002734 [Rhodotorula paludigena]|uniref:uncharacterized protein n=1 Tax=Rhodotorula paludigena TaxID=86838 RepID=UPI003181A088
MASVSYSRQEQDDLLLLFDPNAFVPRRRVPATIAPTSSLPRRTPSIASSIASFLADRLIIPSPRPSRPASTLSRPSVAPLLALPPELLLHILHLAIPDRNELTHARERNRILVSLALVHPVLRAYAQNELFSTVNVTTDRTVERLTRSICVPKSRGHMLGNQISTLRVVGSLGAGDGGKALASLVQQLKGLNTLRLEDLDGLELRQFVLHPALRHFSASRCGFRSRFRLVSAARPAHLLSFSLVNCTGHHDSFSGFSLPDLTHLRIWDISLPPPTPMATIEPSEAFRQLAGEVGHQVLDVTVDEQHLQYLYPPSPSSPRTAAPPALKRLVLVKTTLLPLALDAFPPNTRLSTLRLVPPPTFLPHCTSPERAEAHFAALLGPFMRGGQRGIAVGAIHPALEALEELVLDWRYGAWLVEPAAPSAPPPPQVHRSTGGSVTPPFSSAAAAARRTPGQRQQGAADASLRAHAYGRAQLLDLRRVCAARGVEVRVGREGEGTDVYAEGRRGRAAYRPRD